jgi:DNA-directed RNA polymerase sigma subunit (sigma70/sigma32)
MKKYNVKNYIRYKEDVKLAIGSIPVKRFVDYTPRELKTIFLPLVENIGRKFATSQEASGVMSIMDIIQEGSLQLCKAVDKIDRVKLIESEDQEKTLKSFLAKRIRGGIRRAIDINRGTMRIDEKMVRMFFNSIFLSIDAKQEDEDMIYQIPDKKDPYNETLLNAYLLSLLNKYLEWNEMFVLNKSYGLDGPKWSANEIAAALEIKGVSAYVRVSELKKQAVEKLIENVDHSQVLDYL